MLQEFERSDVAAVGEMHDNGQYASFSESLIDPQMQNWGRLVWIYLDCAKMNPEKRPTLSVVKNVLSSYCNTVPLKYSQQSAIVMNDEEFARSVELGSLNAATKVVNHGINACAF